MGGGDCSKVQEQVAVDVQSIYSTTSAFAALKADGSVVTWGSCSTKPCHIVQSGVYVLVVGGARHVGESGCVTNGPSSDPENPSIKIMLSSGKTTDWIKVSNCQEY